MVKIVFQSKLKIATVMLLTVGLLSAGAIVWRYCRPAAEDPSPAPPTVLQDGEHQSSNIDKAEDNAKALRLDEMAWGETVNGLQAGVGVVPANQRATHTGKKVSFLIKIRNVSEDTREFSYTKENRNLRNVPPTVEDSNGKSKNVNFKYPYDYASITQETRNLKPGEVFDFGGDSLTVLQPEREADKYEHSIWVNHGTYMVQYKDFASTLVDGKRVWFETGKASFEVKSLTAFLTRAEISFQRDKKKGPPNKLIVVNMDDLGKLADFFPDLGEGKNSFAAQDWEPALVIEFYTVFSDNYSDVGVCVSARYDAWREGRWTGRIMPGLDQFIAELVRKE
jgi:hypothetical protein